MDGTFVGVGFFGLGFIIKLAGQEDCLNGEDGGCGNCIYFLFFFLILPFTEGKKGEAFKCRFEGESV